MKICYISHYASLYGANKSLLDMIDCLLNEEFITKENLIIAFSEEGDLLEAIKSRGIRYINIDFEADTFDPGSLKATLARKRRSRARDRIKSRIVQTIKSFEPDIIHSNSSVFDVGALTAEVMGIPHVWHVREDIENHYGRKFDNPGRMYRAMKAAAAVISPSAYIQKMLHEKGVGQVEVLKDLVKLNPDLKKDKEQQVKHRNGITFGVVGLLHPKKNQEFIAKALIPILKGNEGTRLKFYGTGSQDITQKIKDMAKRVELVDRMTLEGYTENAKIYREIDVLINASEDEAFGRVTLEAAGHGIPVIGLKSGATPELVKHNETGILISKSEEELRNAAIALMDSDFRKKLGDSAKAHFVVENDYRKFAETLMEIYRRAVQSPRN